MSLKLDDFIEHQNPVYHQVLRELKAGRKESHWIWFIFPQLAGLGFSAMANRFGITSLAEAREYLRHPVLGQRLRECIQTLLDLPGNDIESILGYPDDLKLRSSMTLFTIAAPEGEIFQAVLDKYFGGERDPKTLDLLQGIPPE